MLTFGLVTVLDKLREGGIVEVVSIVLAVPLSF